MDCVIRASLKKQGDNKLVPLIKTTLVEAKEKLPEAVVQRSGLAAYSEMQDATDKNNMVLANVCMYFANASIYETGVFQDGDKFVYRSKVDNTGLFYPLLLADYVANTEAFVDSMPNATFKIEIGMDVPYEIEKDPLVYLMNTVFKAYYPNIDVNFYKF